MGFEVAVEVVLVLILVVNVLVLVLVLGPVEGAAGWVVRALSLLSAARG